MDSGEELREWQPDESLDKQFLRNVRPRRGRTFSSTERGGVFVPTASRGWIPCSPPPSLVALFDEQHADRALLGREGQTGLLRHVWQDQPRVAVLGWTGARFGERSQTRSLPSCQLLEIELYLFISHTGRFFSRFSHR